MWGAPGDRRWRTQHFIEGRIVSSAAIYCGVMSRRGAALVLILAWGVSGCSTASTTSRVPASSSAQPVRSNTATRTPTPTATSGLASAGAVAVAKVLVFIVENHSLGQMKSQMPYTFGLAQRFGYATNYTAIRHPSLPNYVAIAGGQTYGITNDDKPSANPVRGTSVFGQAIAAGKTAAVFAEGMPENLRPATAGRTTLSSTTPGRTSPTNARTARSTTSRWISSSGRSPMGCCRT